VSSAKAVVLATRALPEPFDSLREDFEVRVLGGAAGELELAAEIKGVDALVCLVDDAVTGTVIQAADRLRIIASYAVGVDQIDRAAAAARGIVVTNTPNVLTDATADLTMALLLALSRRIVEGDRMVRAGGFAGWSPDLLLGRELKGKVFGVVGPGRIGKAVARRARAFGMTVIAFGRSPRHEGDPDDPPRVSFDELLRRSDVVSIHVPLTEDTRRLFSAETFAKMKPGSLLLNTARGSIVDEIALARALEAGTLAGAGLDVYENEPAVTPALLDDDRVVLMPHAGSATVETRREMARMVVEDVRRVLSGEKPLRPVPPEGGRR
jgi:glyoxylate reductase